MIIILALPAFVNGQGRKKNIETVKYTTSITCQDCVNTIMKNLPLEKGIKDVRCDLKTKEVTVAFDSNKNNPEEIKKLLEKLGYTAKIVEKGEKSPVKR